MFPLFVGERTARRLTRRRPDGPHDIVAVPEVPRALNALLRSMCRLDRAVLRRRDLPFGSSVFLAATRPR